MRINPLAPIMFHRYPAYFRMIWSKIVLPYRVRKTGAKLDGEVSFAGYPIISMETGSSITIGQGSTMCSESASTALGVNHPIILRTMAHGAVIKIGSGVRMSGTTICAASRIEIGDRVCLGANVMIVDTDFHSLNAVERSSDADSLSAISSTVIIGHDVFIGAGVYILKGVSIGNNAIIGAGSVVVKNIPAFTIAAGNPAKVLSTVPGHNLPDSQE